MAEDDEYPDDGAAVVRFTIPAAQPVGEQLCDRLLALRPLGTVDYDAGDGRTREALECYVVEICTDEGAGKSYVDHGRVPIPWDHPRRELRKATSDAPWVLGTIVKRNVAYFLNPPKPPEVRVAMHAVGEFMADRKADREAREAAAKAAQEAAAPKPRQSSTRRR